MHHHAIFQCAVEFEPSMVAWRYRRCCLRTHAASFPGTGGPMGKGISGRAHPRRDFLAARRFLCLAAHAPAAGLAGWPTAPWGILGMLVMLAGLWLPVCILGLRHPQSRIPRPAIPGPVRIATAKARESPRKALALGCSCIAAPGA